MRFLVLTILLSGACGYGPSADVACADLANARCRKRYECSSGTLFPHVFPDLATCVSRESISCNLQLAAAGTKHAALDVETCAVSYASISCGDLAVNDPGPACSFVGALGNGATCAFASQCASGYCSGTKNSQCGTCAEPLPVGASCATSLCPAGLNCISSTTTCEPLLGEGETCNTGATGCNADLACIQATPTSPYTCQPNAATIGSPCDAANERCNLARGSVCSTATATRVCVPVAFAGDGKPCGALASGTTALCALGGSCFTSSGITTTSTERGVCKAPANDGAPCDAVLGPLCVTPARCVSPTGATTTTGTCQIADATACQ